MKISFGNLYPSTLGFETVLRDIEALMENSIESVHEKFPHTTLLNIMKLRIQLNQLLPALTNLTLTSQLRMDYLLLKVISRKMIQVFSTFIRVFLIDHLQKQFDQQIPLKLKGQIQNLVSLKSRLKILFQNQKNQKKLRLME